MLSYISFFNDTKYPFVSVYADYEILEDCLPRQHKSRFYVVDAGSITITVTDNRKNTFLDVYLSLYPNEFRVIKFSDSFAEFI